MTNVLLIEDEPLAAQKLERLLKELRPELTVLKVLPSVRQAVAWLDENPSPDLIFSDIRIQDGLSFEIFRRVEVSCPVIFTTAYDQYAIEAFEVNSVDYLLKPVTKKALKNSFEKVEQMRSAFQVQQNIQQLARQMEAGRAEYKNRFLVKVGQRIRTVKTTEIAYFYSEDKVTFLRTADNTRYPVDYTLEEITEMLDPQLFFRANRQFLIHIEAVHEVHPYFKGRVKLSLLPDPETEVVVSSGKTPLFKEWLGG